MTRNELGQFIVGSESWSKGKKVIQNSNPRFLVCKKCGNEFFGSYSNRQYCDGCRFKTCPTCKNKFYIKVNEKEPSRYCSRKCYSVAQKGKKKPIGFMRRLAESNKGRKTGKFITCLWCGKTKYKYPRDIKKNNK